MTGIALMGAGRMAKVHAASIIEAGARVATIYDPVAAAAEALAAGTGAKTCATAAEAMANSSTAAIMIAVVRPRPNRGRTNSPVGRRSALRSPERSSGSPL